MRNVALGAGAPIAAGLLAACGSSSTGSSTSSVTGTTSTSAASGTTATSATAAGGAATTVSGAATPSQATGAAASPAPKTSQTSSASGQQFKVEPAQHKGGQIVIGSTGDAKILTSILSEDSSSNTMITMLFNGVMRIDPSTTDPVGDLAKSWNISPDGMSYEFTLHDGVKWHDGQPFTANDVKFTYDLMLNPKSNAVPYSTVSARIDTVEVADDTHFTIKLKKPNSAFLASNTTYGVLPQHILKDVEPKLLAQDSFSTGKKGRTIGTGPFMFDSWVKDDHATVVKNPTYFKGEPNLDKLIFKVVPDQTVEAQQLKTGEIDYGSVQPASYNEMVSQSGLVTHAYDTFSFTQMCFNLDPAKNKVFQDREVRQAIYYAMDRPTIVKSVYFGLASVSVGTMPLISWAYNPDGIKLKYPHDPEKSKQLLDSAGWKVGSDGIRSKNGVRLSFTLLTGSADQTISELSQVFQQAWKAIGIECKLKTLEWNAFLTRITEVRQFDMYLDGFGFSVDPDQTSMWACSSYKSAFNDAKYCNPQVDKLLQQGLATTDHAKRKQIYTEMDNILMEDLPQMLPFFTKAVTAVNKRAHNVFPNAVSSLFNLEQWWVDA